MENRVFMLFFVLVGLSLFFSASSAVILFVKRNLGMRFSPFAWTVFFLSFCVPHVLPFHKWKVNMYVNYSGGVRLVDVEAEQDEQENSEASCEPSCTPEENVRPGIYVSRDVLSVLFEVSLIYIGIRDAKAAASLYLNFSSYFNTLHFLTKYSTECNDEHFLVVFREAGRKAGVRRNIPLLVMDDGVMIFPCTCGTILPSVYIGRNQIENYGDDWTIGLSFSSSTSSHTYVTGTRFSKSRPTLRCRSSCHPLKRKSGGKFMRTENIYATVPFCMANEGNVSGNICQ